MPADRRQGMVCRSVLAAQSEIGTTGVCAADFVLRTISGNASEVGTRSRSDRRDPVATLDGADVPKRERWRLAGATQGAVCGRRARDLSLLSLRIGVPTGGAGIVDPARITTDIERHITTRYRRWR